MDEDLIHPFITGMIFTLGAATVCLSTYACVKFQNFKRDLSKHASVLSNAVSWQLWGEAIIGAGTLVFATAEFLGYLKNWSYFFTSFLRFTMFTATAITTLHLVRVIHLLKHHD